ncbi:MAG: hypothetical protein SA339_08420 [Methanomassiliicoccus sp.]|nr:hypothetical protein [Methanomassiliicoccus sp.]
MPTCERKQELWCGKRAKILSNNNWKNTAVEMLQPTRENVLRAVWNRLRVEPRNIHLDEIIDELGLCIGEDLTYVRMETMLHLQELQVPAEVVHGRVVYFPEVFAE